MNFKNQKGATGSDIIISMTIIIITVAVVSMIYVNTTLQSRNVTRTAGATRIATNMLENMEKMSYADFDAEYNSIAVGWNSITSGDYNGYKSATNTTAFNTKIPKGYIVYLYAEPSYGSHVLAAEQFDLVREIKLSVTYHVGDVNEKVDFSTSKTREIVDEVNAPNTDILSSQGIVSIQKKFYPVKYSEDAGAYIKTSTDDSDWYNYSNKKWAMVIVSTEPESTLFDVNGKVIADTSKYAKYTWIPKYFYTGERRLSEDFRICLSVII